MATKRASRRSQTAREFVSKPSLNPLDVLGDLRAACVVGGSVTAYLKRKWAYKRYRNVFGVASNDPERGIVYLGVKEDGTPDPSTTVKNAKWNRLGFNAVGVVAGSFIILQVQDPLLDYFALGVIGSDGANIALVALNVE